MSFLYLTGANLNTFGRGTVSVSPTAASVSAAANAYDGDPSCPLLFSATGAGYLKVDCNALTNPGFETSTLSGWTIYSDTGGSACTETTTAGEFRSGSKAMKMTNTGGSNVTSRYQEFTVRSGEYRTASFYVKTSSSGTVNLYLQNRATGNYYNGSAWVGTSSAAVTVAATGSFVQSSVAYRIETFDTANADTATLRWIILCSAGTLFVDDCLDVPGVTFASVHGHNLTADPTVESSDDDSSWTTRATMTRKRPAFWTSFSIIYARYWKIAWASAQTAPYLGEAVLGQYETSTTAPQWGLAESRDLPGVRTRGPSGKHAVYNFATDAPKSIKLTFSARTAAAARELAESLWLRSGQGLYPTIFVPIDTETEVYYGRLIAPIEQSRPYNGVYDCELNLAGDPFPTVTT